MQSFKSTNVMKLALILFVSAGGPGMSHVNEAHSLKTEQGLVTGPARLSLKDRTDGAELTYEGAPSRDFRETETSILLEPGNEWSTDTDAHGVIGSTTGGHELAIRKVKTLVGE